MVTICDIDLYRKAPVINYMGDWYVTKRLKAPEEYIKDSVITEDFKIMKRRTNKNNRETMAWICGKCFLYISVAELSSKKSSTLFNVVYRIDFCFIFWKYR